MVESLIDCYGNIAGVQEVRSKTLFNLLHSKLKP